MPTTFYIKLIAVLALVAAIAGGVLYVRNLQVDVDTLTKNNEEITEQLEGKKAELLLKESDFVSIRIKTKTLEKYNEDLKTDFEKLEEKFDKVRSNGSVRDLGALAKRHPLMVQKIINNATFDANRCLEIASGAKPKENEKNSICSSVVKNNK